ncbi:MAG: hypothetical protein MUC96_05530 [Myxococcaceae bacterium]|nr:hypothetical protein [Myxococcaceae bacterium]
MSDSSAENRIPTQTFLLPGQSFCVGQPWERADLPLKGLPPAPVKPPPATGNLLEGELVGDPCAGWTIGRCEVVRRLSKGSARRLLALRREGEQVHVVDLRQLDVGDGDGPLVEAWAHEASKLYHPLLASVFDCEVSDEGTFWVTERVAGATLAEVLTACRAQGRAMPLGFVLAAVHDAALALGAVHARTSHGLVSPHAVAVAFDGTVKLLEAGLFPCVARRRSWPEVLEATGPYLAPEQVLHGRPPDPKADVFSLAALLYEGLAGEPLRRAEGFDERVKAVESRRFAPPSTLHVMLGKSLDEVMFRALSTDRAWRYPTGAAFAKELKKAVSSFMWRPDARAEFLGQLFDGRLAQERALTAHLHERRTRTASIEVPRVEVAQPAIAVVEAPVVERPVVLQQPKAPVSKRRTSPVARAWAAPVAALVGLGLGFGVHWALRPTVEEPAPVVARPVVAPEDPEPLVFVDQPMSELPAVLATIGPLVVPPAPAVERTPVRTVKRLRARGGEAPVPPWLQKSSRRRR